MLSKKMQNLRLFSKRIVDSYEVMDAAALGQYHCVALTEHSWRCSRLASQITIPGKVTHARDFTQVVLHASL